MAPRKRNVITSAVTANPRKREAMTPQSKFVCSYTSLADRKRRAPTLSMASLQNLENEENHEEYFVALMGKNSESHGTWGKTKTGPISPIRKKGKTSRFRNYLTRGNFDSMFGMGWEEADPTMVIQNSPDRSPLLGVPLEVREKIYGFLLVDEKPIVTGPDWETVESQALKHTAILYVCKQLSQEASKFIYKNNNFLMMLRTPRKSDMFDKAFSLDAKFLPLFRNVVISCPMDSWNLDWHEKAAVSISKLADAKPILSTLTLVMTPSRGIGMSTTTICMEVSPLHFADFFWFPGPLMGAIRKLNCRVLNIVAKKYLTVQTDGIERPAGIKRVLISVDLRYSQAGMLEEGPLANKETVAIAREKARSVERKLQGLKQVFKEIYKDCEGAIREGLCRELADDERITDGMSLVIRK